MTAALDRDGGRFDGEGRGGGAHYGGAGHGRGNLFDGDSGRRDV